MKLRFASALLALILVVGCGSPKVEINGDKGEKVSVDTSGKDAKVTVKDADGKSVTMQSSNDGKSMTVQGDDGKTKLETGTTITEQDLGIAFYPGSKAIESGTMKMDTPGGKSVMATRTTSDDPEKVLEFYKSKIKSPQATNADNDGRKMAIVTGKTDSGLTVSVSATREKGASETTILVSTAAK